MDSANKRTDYPEEAAAFGVVARQFCALVDSAPAIDRTEFLIRLYNMLPELIASAIRLPEISFEDDPEGGRELAPSEPRAETRVTQEEWSRLYKSLKEKLGDRDLYWQVFNPTTDEEVIRGSLADDITDVYSDLKNGIRLQESSQASADEVIFVWRINFSSH